MRKTENKRRVVLKLPNITEYEERLRQGFLNKSAANRMFFDHLCLLIWCECKKDCTTKSKSWEDWCDIELNYYGTSKDAVVDTDIVCSFNTPRKVLTEKELDAIQGFIDTHTFEDLAQAKMEIASDLFNDCVATSLNILAPGTVKDAKMKEENLQLELKF